MLGDGDAAEDDVLCGGHGDAVVLQGEIARFRAYRVDGFVQQVPLAGGNFTDAVIRTAGVFLGGEFAPVRRGVGIQQGFTLEHPVHSAIQGGIALRFAGSGVHFLHLHGELLQDIGKAHTGGLAGVDGYLLGSRLDVFVWGIFGYGVISSLEVIHLDGPIRSSHHVLLNPVAGDVERNAGNLSVLRGFHKLQGTRLDFKGKIAFHRLGGAFHIEGDHVLVFIPQPVFRAACNHAGNRGRQPLFGGNGSEFGFGGGDVQFIATDGKIHARIADSEISQYIVLIHQCGFVFPIALVVFEIMGICPNRAWIVGGKGRDGVVIHDVFPKLIEDGLRGGAVDGKFIDDLRFVPGPQLPMGNEPDEDLGGDVLVDGAAAVLGSGFHVVPQSQGGVDHGFLLGGKSGVIIRLVITDTRVYAYTELDAVGGAEGFQVVDPQFGELIGTVPAKRGGKIGTEGIPSGVMVDHGDVPVVIVGGGKGAAWHNANTEQYRHHHGQQPF